MTARAGGASLRREVRLARNALAPAARQAADSEIRSRINRLPAYRSARRVALFFAFDGEPDVVPLINFSRRREYYAPVVAGSEMRFARIDRDTRLVSNDFGIPEPADLTLVDPRSIDLVLTPLVAFDSSGNRVGVGGGFYDRCFSFLLGRTHWHRPKLIGVAYSLQQIEPFAANPWDVPLWGSVTERNTFYFRGGE